MDTIKIAIYDESSLGIIQTVALLKYYDQASLFEISMFSHPSMLLASENAYDIVILDIGSQEPNGYEVACKLRARVYRPVIIFVSANHAYAHQGYGLALRYLLKPINQEDMNEALDAAITALNANRCTFDCGKTTCLVRPSDICYIETHDHFITIHTEEQCFELRGKTKAILKQLPQSCFAIPHKGYVVNLEYVRSVTATVIELRDKTLIPVSRRRLTEFKEKLRQFLTNSH